jgi:hypothetical protein
MEIGAEKLRYLTGIAIAVNHKGRVAVISLDDVYRKAARTFRVQGTRSPRQRIERRFRQSPCASDSKQIKHLIIMIMASHMII